MDTNNPATTGELPRPAEEPELLADGIFEPPTSPTLSALGRNKWLIGVFAGVFAVIGIAAGLLRPAVYEASTTIQVGQVNPNSPGFLGYVQSSSSLATAFSRSIAAASVLSTVDHKLGISPVEAASRLSAEPIPLSPAFRVIATASTRTAAMRLANVATGAVIAYENRSNSSNPQAQSLLHDYRAASIALRRAEAEAAGSPPASGEDNFLSAQGRQSAARIKRKAISNAYIAAVVSAAPRDGLVTLLAGATSAESDRKTKIELYGFLGLLAGIIFGGVVAALRGRKRNRV